MIQTLIMNNMLHSVLENQGYKCCENEPVEVAKEVPEVPSSKVVKDSVQNNLPVKKQDLNNDECKDDFIPKKSSRMSKTAKRVIPDGDTWIERIVVLDAKTRSFRSYFVSQKTNRRVWDEPPSGASNMILIGDKTYPENVKSVHLKGRG